eukprot:TRINITY_DN89941_c0_g1_i1.p1 TRINITY_DN89941_c0_g1~~TRINITY_DN89941_c0_g1_i1.p1  ORF type:complete len:380 (+),score=55.02 TRINITY_DN89941_c0_g1_i1:161-1300(+)
MQAYQTCVLSCPLKRHRRKKAAVTSGESRLISQAALAVFGQYDPLFHCWLCGTEEGMEALNPSPFDIYALLCAGRLFAHLGQRSPLSSIEEDSQVKSAQSSAHYRKRLYGKQPVACVEFCCRGPEPGSVLAASAQTLVLSLRVTRTISHAVVDEDLDAIRFHLFHSSLSKPGRACTKLEEALALSVRFSKLSLVRYLLQSADPHLGWSKAFGTSLFHLALANCMDRDSSEDCAPMEVLEAILSQTIADLDAPIWPELPALGSAPVAAIACSSPESQATSWIHRHGGESLGRYGFERLKFLPFIKRGQVPLAWVIHVHTSTCANESLVLRARLCAVAQSLVKHGASQSFLSRRQQRSLSDLLLRSSSAVRIQGLQQLACV